MNRIVSIVGLLSVFAIVVACGVPAKTVADDTLKVIDSPLFRDLVHNLVGQELASKAGACWASDVGAPDAGKGDGGH